MQITNLWPSHTNGKILLPLPANSIFTYRWSVQELSVTIGGLFVSYAWTFDGTWQSAFYRSLVSKTSHRQNNLIFSAACLLLICGLSVDYRPSVVCFLWGLGCCPPFLSKILPVAYRWIVGGLSVVYAQILG